MSIEIMNTIIASLGFLLSLFALYFTWISNHGQIILQDNKISASRSGNKLSISILFIFKNIGKENIHINKISIGKININKDSSFDLINSGEIVNIINYDESFNYNINFILELKDNFNELSDSELSDRLPQIIGKVALFLKMNYLIKRFGFYKSNKLFYKYMLYTGGAGLGHLDKKDFNIIKSKISKDFILK